MLEMEARVTGAIRHMLLVGYQGQEQRHEGDGNRVLIIDRILKGDPVALAKRLSGPWLSLNGAM